MKVEMMSESHNAVGSVDHARIERAVREILEAIGEDPSRDGLVDTPLSLIHI